MNKKQIEEINSVSPILELLKGCDRRKTILSYRCGELIEFQIPTEVYYCPICKTKIKSEKQRLDDMIKKIEDFLDFLNGLLIEGRTTSKGKDLEFLREIIEDRNKLIKQKISELQEELRKLKMAREKCSNQK